MTDKRKAPAGVGTPNEALTETGEALVSYEQNITESGQIQGRIAALLPRGEENALPTLELMALAGYASVRQLQKQIEAERAAGALILSASAGGYFLPKNRAEILRYERTLHSRAVNTLRTLQSARRALARIDGQMRVEAGDVDGRT